MPHIKIPAKQLEDSNVSPPSAGDMSERTHSQGRGMLLLSLLSRQQIFLRSESLVSHFWNPAVPPLLPPASGTSGPSRTASG